MTIAKRSAVLIPPARDPRRPATNGSGGARPANGASEDGGAPGDNGGATAWAPLAYLTERILRPLLGQLGYDFRVASWRGLNGPLDSVWLDTLWSSDLVIFETTEQDPQTMYEMGVRHATGLSTLCFSLPGVEPIFALRHAPIILYDPKNADLHDAAKQDLAVFLNAISHLMVPIGGRLPPVAPEHRPTADASAYPGSPLMEIADGVVELCGVRLTAEDLDFIQRERERLLHMGRQEARGRGRPSRRRPDDAGEASLLRGVQAHKDSGRRRPW